MIKQNLEVGRKYRGSFWINEYGEIQVRPEQKGTKPSNLKIVLEHETFTIYESKEIFKVSIKIAKKNFSTINLTNKFVFIINTLKNYLK